MYIYIYASPSVASLAQGANESALSAKPPNRSASIATKHAHQTAWRSSTISNQRPRCRFVARRHSLGGSAPQTPRSQPASGMRRDGGPEQLRNATNRRLPKKQSKE